jgi:predicted nucleic acid-binding protein
MAVFLDANVFLYAAGADPRCADPCRRLLLAVESGALDATTSTEVVQEVLHVVSRRRGNALAVQAAEAVLDLVPAPIAVTADVMRGAIELLRKYPQLSVRDGVHAAAMASVGCAVVVSADRHFDQVAGLKRIDPLVDGAVAGLVGT